MAKAAAHVAETLIYAGIAALMAVSAASARADEVFVGAFAHDVSSVISSHGVERGMDVNAGYRTAPLGFLSAIGRPMLYGTYFGNTDRRTSYGAIGFQWRRYMLSDRLYGLIGIGGALHDQPVMHADPFAPGLTPAEMNERLYLRRDFKPLGSRFLFNPNLAMGFRLSSRWAIEAAWSHISNAGLGCQNPGMDDFGGRVVYRFGPERR